MPDQVKNEIEDLRLDMDGFSGPPQLASFHVDRTLAKQDAHGLISCSREGSASSKLAGF
jgi:hypothetical protein